MDNYPPGHPTFSEETTATVTCTKCGCTWSSVAFVDHAVNYVEVEEEYCDVCGTDADIEIFW